ncbi:hypothetical protein [Streptosporangium saharense]|uniref:Uncharacterized protein n=1 Tax=Streptosporangium saharense TaxID=1706840 RepID=A0A7W7QPF6_9ACTN|nr:hypothetical protein [Streptosporangium saharense]MBB4917361.1 hypothetical protein [Streptosporangium saharense]
MPTKFLRAASVLLTVTVFIQTITAGLLLSSPTNGPLHSAGAYTVFVVAVLHLVVAILAWRPGGGSPGPILYAAGFLVITSAQVALGIAHLTTLHVPLGALMFGTSLLQLTRLWPTRASAAQM